ncbi:hypothetical protein HRG_012285 [Hirsutella rhossiliensis]
MADCNEFEHFARGAFPCDSLPLVHSALKSLERRYPNAEDPIPKTSTQWEEYALRVSNSPPANLSSSLLKLASGGSLDVEIVREYLELLRQDVSCTKIFDVRDLREGASIAANEGSQEPVIIPYHGDNQWAFAVAYDDVIHWYDSKSRDVPIFSASGSRSVVTNWTGPKSDAANSGVVMLLGIRCLQRGFPHRSQRVAEGMVSSFRSYVLVELLCQKLNPAVEDFEQLLAQERENESLFFLDATHGMDEDSQHPAVAPIMPPESGTSVMAACSPDLNLGSEQAHRPRPLFPDNRRVILDHLSEAVLANRSIGMSAHTNLAVLWHSVKRGTLGSVFHERYHAVLFYDQMNRLDDDAMRSVQSQCKFCWEGKYTLLLALPGTPSIRGMRNAEKRRIIADIQSRLDEESDPFKRWLHQAQYLCAAIVNQELPEENLMIDVYHLKWHETIGDNEYRAYTSVDPRFKLPLPRLATAY